jgi:LmbE family N-acetylglucosaminyl deacetylase
MKFNQSTAEIFIPDGTLLTPALLRTTHLAIGAHPDDLEIMAAAPILECFQNPNKWFTGVVVTDGRGSPRTGAYRDTPDEQMRQVRLQEQRKAAILGEYGVLVMLDYPSSQIKDGSCQEIVDDLADLLRLARPEVVYTHNLADKHDTHIGVALRTIAAIRRLPETERPQRLIGCEVWRSLDWMQDADKLVFDLSGRLDLQASLLAVFDSQISAGKRYDLAAEARRRANATYSASHTVDQATAVSFGMDMTPLLQDDSLDPWAFVQAYLDRFARDVEARLRRMQ